MPAPCGNAFPCGVVLPIGAMAELRTAREALAQRAVAEERLRFARDLHDLLGHSLPLIVLKNQLAGRLLPADLDRAAKEIREAEKERLSSCRVIILTTFGRTGYLKPAMESGASGFLLKNAPAAELAAAIRRVMSGEQVVDASSLHQSRHISWHSPCCIVAIYTRGLRADCAVPSPSDLVVVIAPTYAALWEEATWIHSNGYMH